MKIITTIFKKREQQYNIYENVQEFEQSGLSVKHITDADIGDYILTHNGFYIPVLNIVEFQHGVRLCRKVYFPRHQVMIWKRKDDTWGYKNIIYPIESDQREQKIHLTGKVKLFGSMIAKGYDFYDSFYKVFSGADRDILDNIIQSQQFISYLEGLGYMENIRKSFEDNNLTGSYVAEKIKDILSEPTGKDNAQLKKWALETIMDVIDDKRPTITKNTVNINQNDVDMLIQTSNQVSLQSSTVPPALVEDNSSDG